MEISKAPKSDLPPTLWGKVLGATPIVMTVIATVLAGLASSEMTRAQYDRSLAGQLQAKASDQWNLFQAKKLRGALQLDTVDLLEAAESLQPVSAANLQQLFTAAPGQSGSAVFAPEVDPFVQSLADPQTLKALELFRQGALPDQEKSTPLKSTVQAAAEAVAAGRDETEVALRLAAVDPADLAEAVRLANARSQSFDTLLTPITRTIARAESAVHALLQLGQSEAAGDPGRLHLLRTLERNLAGQRLRYANVRYGAEALLNRDIAVLYELQLRQNNLSADRHHERSQQFFLGMLAAQMAVVVATFAVAARQRNFLWGLAAAAGLGAVGFASYVYLFT